MNKKLLISLSSVAIAAGFWACGDGVVENMSGDDELLSAVFGTLDFTNQIAHAKDTCAKVAACENEMAVAIGKAVELSSSEVATSSETVPQSSVTQVSSSIFKFSSIASPSYSSSSSTVAPPPSSSSIAAPITGLGACGPTTGTVDLNAPATWSFTASEELKKDMNNLMSIKYAWSFPGGTPESSTDKTPKVTYSTSGQKTATVKVTLNSGSGEVTCSPLNVNGAKITGCECTTAAPSVDFTSDPNVTWTVTGCKSTVTPLIYEWDGGAPGSEASYTKTFTAAQNGYAPTLKVSHADNTIISVQCPAVKTTAGPEYQLTVTGNQLPEKAVNVKNEGCIVVNGEWTNEYDKPNLKVTCEYAVQGVANLTLNMTYNGKTTPKSGGYNVQNSVELGAVPIGTLNYPSVCVTFTGGSETSTASCKLAR
ncbi:MAG: PKD domain-containing protein [Fibrobacter sp.]|uniref:PKD domain-containing protein n=1 Tax=Fibrobacter sp. TaxID=35828 RepID=UPI0025C6D360|nr:hypothetical protein [Fibrobacter sp.]MBR4785752.1 PKD domain-containing protein [Fibrobacter sp.]